MSAKKKSLPKSNPDKQSPPKTSVSKGPSSKSRKKTVRTKTLTKDRIDDNEKVSEVKMEDNPLTKEDLRYFRELLLQKRRELLGDVGHMRTDTLDNNRFETSGDLSNMPIHMADVGTDNYEQEFTLGLIESERKLLREIDRALSKFDKGTYGLCEATGKPIVRARLEAKPEARYSIEYARMIEKGQAHPIPEDIEI